MTFRFKETGGGDLEKSVWSSHLYDFHYIEESCFMSTYIFLHSFIQQAFIWYELCTHCFPYSLSFSSQTWTLGWIFLLASYRLSIRSQEVKECGSTDAYLWSDPTSGLSPCLYYLCCGLCAMMGYFSGLSWPLGPKEFRWTGIIELVFGEQHHILYRTGGTRQMYYFSTLAFISILRQGQGHFHILSLNGNTKAQTWVISNPKNYYSN